jgi:anthranilate synthase/aminodeoxychorismate synthase-like glutamine amidotransferase
MIIMIDNYDSFTYNLVQYLEILGQSVHVYRNDAITIQEIEQLNPKAIVISPGPGNPDQAGICLEIVNLCKHKNIPLLGICLGHQCIGQAFGAKIIQAKVPMHGKMSDVSHDSSLFFSDIPSPLPVARYHSLVIDPDTVPDSLQINAYSEDQQIMAVSYKDGPIYGIQFHPESFATHHGMKILGNFLELN